MKSFLLLIILMVGFIHGTIGAAPWTVNPYDYRYDMGLYLDCEIGSGVTDYNNYSFGAFVGEECRGVAELLNLEGSSSNIYYLRVYSNKVSGEKISFKAYDSKNEKTYNSETILDFKSDESLGLPSAPYKLNFIVEVDNISISPANSELTVGETVQLTPTITPACSSDKNVTWLSSDVAVATVSDGLVKGNAPGKTTITAKSSNGKTSSATIEVKPIEVSSISLNKTEYIGRQGTTLQLTATVSPADATDKKVTWTSSDSEVATVDGNGLVTLVKIGNATITATSGSVSATCKVTVTAPTAENVTLTPASGTIKIGGTLQLSAVLTPSNAETTLTWSSSDTKVVSVNDRGLVTGVSEGSATITVNTSEGLSATASVKVEKNVIAVTSVTLDRTEYSGRQGTTLQLTATVSPADATDKKVTWTSSDSEVATVDGNGLVTLVKVGNATITATSGSASATCKVTVTAPSAENVTLTPSSGTIKIGGTLQLSAVLTPSNAETTLTWSSSDTKVASVSDKGLVTGVSEGSATITVKTSEGLSATASVKVEKNVIAVTSVTLDRTEYSGRQGTTLQLTATVSPADATDKKVTWTSSDSEVATVDGNGLVTLVKVGNATITATSGSASATCKVTVTAPSAENVTLTPTSGTIKIGGTLQLSAVLTPSNAETTLTWSSSDTKVASVSDKGLVTGVSEGSATITVKTSEGLTAKASIKVDKDAVEVTGIEVSPTSAELSPGETIKINAVVTPSNATNKSITWTSSNESVAIVDKDGIVKAISSGKAVIKGTAGNVSATCEITVIDKVIDPEEIILNIYTASINVGESIDLIATVLPENSTNKDVIWSSSSPEVALVNENGNVSAISSGVAIITARCGEIEASCEVTVYEEAGIESVISESDNISIYTIEGKIVRKDTAIKDLKNLSPGIYIIKCNTKTIKIAI